ncbi:MAG: two-component histidine kinase CzrS [Pseudomonadota bacterium]|jgi:signal transduction histidine kinase
MSPTLEMDLETVGSLLLLVAHDLRNPLSALHSNIGFIGSAGPGDDTDVRDALVDSQVSCDDLAHIINNLDLFGQALRETRHAEPLPMSAAAFARDVVSRCQRVAESHRLRLLFDERAVDPSIEAYANRELLGRALGNLVRNSIQHSPENSLVELRIVGPQADRASGEPARVQFMVCDQGAAIDTELGERVFTFDGQLMARGKGESRYSRGMGLLSARLAASASGASVACVPPPDGFANSFCLIVPVSAG